MNNHQHIWKVAAQETQVVNVVDKWQSYVSRGRRLPDDIEVHTRRFIADEEFVQLACECGAYASARNELPIVGPS